MKCWVIFSLLLLLEISLTYRVRGRVVEVVKVAVLAWCLAPATYNGSDLLFDLVLAPLHWAAAGLASSATPCLSCLQELASDYVLQPTVFGASLILAKSLQLASFLAAEVPGEII